ncbi:hypothetical protein ACFCYM_03620 [Streptomyces sp. NPDC056254]|uniref:hypothetical protein n=1 Tax=Streptomyces sp. NPDC056254 TaxID=3345763 RepID=UPI0035E299F5
MRPATTSVQRGSVPPAESGTTESGFEDPLPAPVFVDQSGLRGRLLRGVGWPVSVIGAILAVAMGSSLIGVQADAPAMGIPAQPSRPPVPSPAQASPQTPQTPASSPRAVARSAAPGTKATPAAKTSGTPPRTATTPTRTAGTAPKPANTAQRGAKPSDRPAKQP